MRLDRESIREFVTMLMPGFSVPDSDFVGLAPLASSKDRRRRESVSGISDIRRNASIPSWSVLSLAAIPPAVKLLR
jgi:hypothetical protein